MESAGEGTPEQIEQLLERAKDDVPEEQKDAVLTDSDDSEGAIPRGEIRLDAEESGMHGRYVEYDLKYDGGIRSFVEHLNNARRCEVIHNQVIYMKAEKGRHHRGSGHAVQ